MDYYQSTSDSSDSSDSSNQIKSKKVEPKLLLFYYLIKRSFLFMDEWLFYLVLYKLLKSGYHKIMTLVFLYGISCIYTSYSNIEKIENQLTGIDQMIWLTDFKFRDLTKYLNILLKN